MFARRNTTTHLLRFPLHVPPVVVVALDVVVVGLPFAALDVSSVVVGTGTIGMTLATEARTERTVTSLPRI